MLSKVVVEQVIDSQLERLKSMDIFSNGKIKGIFQVCYQVDQNNMDREIAGAMQAMEFFNHHESIIVTHDQSDTFSIKDKTIHVIPFYLWAGQNN